MLLLHTEFKKRVFTYILVIKNANKNGFKNSKISFIKKI